MRRLNVILLIIMMVIATIGCVEKDENPDVFNRSEAVSQTVNPQVDNENFMAYGAGYITGGHEEIIDKVTDIDDGQTIFTLQLTKSNTSLYQLKEGVSTFVNDYDGVTYSQNWRTYRTQGREIEGAALQANDVAFNFPNRGDIYIPEAEFIVLYWPDRIEFVTTYPRQ